MGSTHLYRINMWLIYLLGLPPLGCWNGCLWPQTGWTLQSLSLTIFASMSEDIYTLYGAFIHLLPFLRPSHRHLIGRLSLTCGLQLLVAVHSNHLLNLELRHILLIPLLKRVSKASVVNTLVHRDCHIVLPNSGVFHCVIGCSYFLQQELFFEYQILVAAPQTDKQHPLFIGLANVR